MLPLLIVIFGLSGNIGINTEPEKEEALEDEDGGETEEIEEKEVK